MTIEAKHSIFGLTIFSREMTRFEGEMLLKIGKLETDLERNHYFAITFRVLSEDEIAVWQYLPNPKKSNRLEKGAPTILTGEEINQANLTRKGMLIKSQITWKPTK
jgi:hypothetical protein